MASDVQNKTNIFFDTNMLECRWDKNCFNVSQPKFSDEYFYIKNFIKDNHLELYVKICIPEIVLMEIKKHLIDCYQSQCNSLIAHMDNFKKIFGDMYEISVNKKNCQTVDEYIDYVNKYFNDILERNSDLLTMIPYPRDHETFEKFVHKAMHSEKPFTRAKGNGKEYTDAGLKDAIIYETICQCEKDNLNILVTNDYDFKELFNEGNTPNNLKLCDNKDDIKEILVKEYNIVNDNYEIKQIIANDEYFRNTLFSKINFEENADYKFGEIIDMQEVEDGNKIAFSAIINGETYKFNIVYELNSKTLVDIIDFEECNEQ